MGDLLKSSQDKVIPFQLRVWAESNCWAGQKVGHHENSFVTPSGNSSHSFLLNPFMSSVMGVNQMAAEPSSACVGNCAWCRVSKAAGKVARDRSGEEGNASGSVPLTFMYILSVVWHRLEEEVFMSSFHNWAHRGSEKVTNLAEGHTATGLIQVSLILGTVFFLPIPFCL